MPKRADDFLRGLEADPAWQGRRAEGESAHGERAAAAAADEAALVAEIRARGYDIESVYDLVNNTPHPVHPRRFSGPYRAAYPILVSHLLVRHIPVIREGIVRALTVKDGGLEVESALVGAFLTETSPPLRWAIANALQTAMPYHRRRRVPEIAAVLTARVGSSEH